MKKFQYLFKTHIAGFSYWNGPKVFEKLKIGSKLTMKREKDNFYDSYAVALYFENEKIGFLPREDNRIIAGFLDLGYEDFFKIRINQLAPSEHPEHQVGIVVYLKNSKNKK